MKSIAPAVVISVLVTWAVAVTAVANGLPAGASEGGAMDAMSIDMDPSSEPGNTATSIGSRQFCARINENDVLDADEDDVDTLEIDVTTGPVGIPASHPMIGFQFALSYDASSFLVTDSRAEYLLAVTEGSSVLNVSDPLPDTNGYFINGALDLADPFLTNEAGVGTLSRLQIASSSDAHQGIHHLVVLDAGHIDSLGDAHPPVDIHHAVIGLDSDCPLAPPEPVPPPASTATPPADPTPPPLTGTGQMDAMSIDMDPSSEPANTATSIGSRQFCARINENDVLDADEDDIDALEIDVTTGPVGIPESHPMFAFNYAIVYGSQSLTIISNDVDMLLDTASGSQIFDASDPVPDTDGKFHSSVLDIGLGTTESGPGVLARTHIASTDGAVAGIHHLVLTEAVHLDPFSDSHAPAKLHHAILAVDVECPAIQPEPEVPPAPTPPPTPPRTSPMTPPPRESPIIAATPTPALAVEPSTQPHGATPGIAAALPSAGGPATATTTGEALLLAVAGFGLASSAVFASAWLLEGRGRP